MSKTEELRRLLDERGVEWGIRNDGNTTVYTERYGRCAAVEFPSGIDVHMFNLTPKRAIEAMTGRGACEIVRGWSDSDYDDDWRYQCSECGCPIPVNERDPDTGVAISAANYCPNCGRKVLPRWRKSAPTPQ